MQAPSVRQFCWYWLPPLLFTAGILLLSGNMGSASHTLKFLRWLQTWFSFLRPSGIEEANFYLRKLGHITAYATLYILWFRALREHFASRLAPAIFWSLCFCLLTSMGDEGHQSFVASRGGSPWDVALDFTAAALTALALFFKSR